MSENTEQKTQELMYAMVPREGLLIRVPAATYWSEYVSRLRTDTAPKERVESPRYSFVSRVSYVV